MTFDQIATLAVLAAVVVALVSEKVRPDVAALTAAGALVALGVVGPAELQRGFASPAILALASLFVITRALERSGVLAVMIDGAVHMAERIGPAAGAVVIGFLGAISAFLNNTPMVVLGAPLVRDMARVLGQSPRVYLMPLSYAAVLGGCCTLIGTSTNLLVDDMAQASDLAAFTLFEITPVGLTLAAAGGLYLLLVAPRLLGDGRRADDGQPEAAAPRPVLRPVPALISLAIFAAVIGGAFGGAPLARCCWCCCGC